MMWFILGISRAVFCDPEQGRIDSDWSSTQFDHSVYRNMHAFTGGHTFQRGKKGFHRINFARFNELMEKVH